MKDCLSKRNVILIIAAERDFHNFDTFYRDDAPLYPSKGNFAKGTMKPKMQTILGYLEKATKEVVLENIC
jgi:carbamate kinase